MSEEVGMRAGSDDAWQALFEACMGNDRSGRRERKWTKRDCAELLQNQKSQQMNTGQDKAKIQGKESSFQRSDAETAKCWRGAGGGTRKPPGRCLSPDMAVPNKVASD